MARLTRLERINTIGKACLSKACLSTNHIDFDGMPALVRIEAVQLLESPLVVGRSPSRDIRGGDGHVDLVVVEDVETPPISAASVSLHAVDDVAVGLGLAKS